VGTPSTKTPAVPRWPVVTWRGRARAGCCRPRRPLSLSSSR